MSGYASFDLPDADGRVISGVFHIEQESRGALCGLVLDGGEKPVCGVTAVLFERDGDICRPVAHTFTDEAGRFLFGPLKTGAHYTVRLWVGEGERPAKPETERDSREVYERYKGLYEK